MLGPLARAFLAVTLLAAWQVALLHPLQHVDSNGDLVHVSDARSPGSDPSSEPSDNLCDALGALGACASGTTGTLTLPSLVYETLLQVAAAPRRAQQPPFLAQAPPILL